MYALVDCNSFFCAVEKVFTPGLQGKPVCVLSNNDGCIIALTPEAKALGLKRCDPVFKVRDIIEKGGVRLFSTDMRRYAAMSRRVMRIIKGELDAVEVYSIDECFCDLHAFEKHHSLEDLMRQTIEKVRLYTDIPASVGIAPTKTLAKIASKFAKKHRGYRSVCSIDTDEKRLKALSLSSLSDVWGIGRQTLEKLRFYGIYSVVDFVNQPIEWVRARFPLPVQRTWLELNGTPCIDTAEHLEKQSICTSRSFEKMVSSFDALRVHVSDYASSCANKLRSQHGVAAEVTVFLSTNRFRQDLEQCYASESHRFLVPTADSFEIIAATTQLLRRLYRPGLCYKKAGVVLSVITADSAVDLHLFDPIANRPARQKLMRIIDQINQDTSTRQLSIGRPNPHARFRYGLIKCVKDLFYFVIDVKK